MIDRYAELWLLGRLDLPLLVLVLLAGALARRPARWLFAALGLIWLMALGLDASGVLSGGTEAGWLNAATNVGWVALAGLAFLHRDPRPGLGWASLLGLPFLAVAGLAPIAAIVLVGSGVLTRRKAHLLLGAAACLGLHAALAAPLRLPLWDAMSHVAPGVDATTVATNLATAAPRLVGWGLVVQWSRHAPGGDRPARRLDTQ